MDKKWPDGGCIDSVKEGRLEIKPGARVKTHAISSKDVGRIRENEFLYACGVDWSYHSEPTIERCIVFDKDLVGYVIKVTNRTSKNGSSRLKDFSIWIPLIPHAT